MCSLGLALGCLFTLGRGPDETEKYQIVWEFQNLSCDLLQFVTFRGEENGDLTEAVTVEPPNTKTVSTTRVFTRHTTDLSVTISYPGGGDTKFLNVDVARALTTRIFAKWDGFTLTLSSIGPGSTIATRLALPQAASACQAPAATWRLEGVTGTAAATFQDISLSGNGSLSGFDPPQTVREGDTYTVSATFSGTLTAAAGWDGTRTSITVGLADHNMLNGINPSNSRQITVTGTISESITVTTAWTPGPIANATSFTLNAGGGFGVAGTPPSLVATYRKVP
jgi:hypothetical protein